MKTKVTKNQLFGKLVIGLSGIFMLFVLAGCEKEKSVTGPTASTTTEANIYDAAAAKSKCNNDDPSGTGTFKMDDYKYYTGPMYVSVDPGSYGCKDWRERNGFATARIIWGPWETEKVNLDSIKKTAIRFQKINRDSIPLTVIVNGCDMPTIELCSGKPQKKDYWKVYTPD